MAFTVTAQDALLNTVTGYTGTVHFTKTDGAASSALPPDYTFKASDLGTHVFTAAATLVTAGTQTLTATDSGNVTITGSTTVSVNPVPLASFAFSKATVSAGTNLAFVVNAVDSFNNTEPNYKGTVHFSSNDNQAVLSGDATFANGVGAFAVTLTKAGTKTITATDEINGASGISTTQSISVTPAAVTKLQFASSGSISAGNALAFNLGAFDAFDNAVNTYVGTVHFSASDSHATVMPDYTFTAADNGVHAFGTGVTFATTGTQTLLAYDKTTNAQVAPPAFP